MLHPEKLLVASIVAWINVSVNLCAIACTSSPPRFVLTDLGTLGGPESFAYDINNESSIVGWAQTAQFAPPPHEYLRITRAFYWHEGVMTELPPWLPAQQPYLGAALGVSDAGHIVGYSSYYVGLIATHPVMWFHGTMYNMGGVSDFNRAQSVNKFGVAVGTGESDTSGSGRAFRWSMETGLTIVAQPVGGWNASGNDIDSFGLIVGGHGPSLGAFLWKNGLMHTLVNGQYGAHAEAINEKGQVVGWCNSGCSIRAFLWSPLEVIDLGTLDGFPLAPLDINDHGWIVGLADTGGGVFRAFLWKDGNIYALNDLVPQLQGWNLRRALAINNKNEIVGEGRPAGPNFKRAFLLRPVGPGDVDADGIVNVADLLALINSWGPCPAQGDCFADFDDNGVVNVADLLTLIENWG